MKLKFNNFCNFLKSKSEKTSLFIKFVKLLYKLICLSLMCYQIITLTINYLLFPFNVKLYLTDDQNKYLPSITICFWCYHQCLLTQFNYDFIIKSDMFSRIIPQESISCKLYFKNNNKSLDCKQISEINEMIIINDCKKCFTYFQKRESYYNLSIINEEISFIQIIFNENLYKNESCYYNPKL
jgi:hypothetical protein